MERKFVVRCFGVDLKFNEEKKVIWEGSATDREDAKQQALCYCYKTEDREFMYHYLSATEFELN